MARLEEFRALKPSNLEGFRALNPSNLEGFRALKNKIYFKNSNSTTTRPREIPHRQNAWYLPKKAKHNIGTKWLFISQQQLHVLHMDKQQSDMCHCTLFTPG